MRIVQNADLPVDQRDWDKDENGDGPKNAVVTAWLNSLSPVIKIRGKAHLQQLLAEVADELTVDIDELINPNKVNRYLKQSDKLRQIMEYVKQHDVEL